MADSYNHKIKIIDFSKPNKSVPITSWIGKSTEKNPKVVDGKEPLLNEPNGVWAYVKQGEFKGIIIADTGNNCIRMAKPNGEVETLELIGIPDVRETASECKDGVCKVDF